MYKENYLIMDDVMELMEAGLDADLLAQMDWIDRFDAIEKAGLSPMDYDYGFMDDDYCEEVPHPVVVKKKAPPKREAVVPNSAPMMKPKRLSRRERKRLEKMRNRTIKELASDLAMYIEAFM